MTAANHNKAIFQEIQQTLTSLSQRRTQVVRDIEMAETNLDAMRKEHEVIEDSITRNEGGLSLCLVINNSNYMITDTEGDRVELDQTQIILRGDFPLTTAPPPPQPAIAPQPTVGNNPITDQAQQKFAPPMQNQG